jgi:hypothetical protein
MTLPIATGYQPGTINGAGTNVNINIGDPIRLTEAGTVELTQIQQSAAGLDSDDFAYGVVVGFPRVIVGGFPRPGSFYTGATAYTGGIGGDNAPLCAFIPVFGNIFEIDMDAAPTVTTLSGLMANVGAVASMGYTVLTSGTGQPKANPLLTKSTIAFASASELQLQIVGVGKRAYTQDFTAAFCTYQVMWQCAQMSIPTAEHAVDGTASIYGANVE